MNLSGKVCVISGGTSGIGAATALQFASKGAHIAIVSRNALKHKPSELISGIEACDVSVLLIEADVADPAACRRCVDQTVTHFGRLDVLVHSAGGAVPGGLFSVTDEAWMNAFAVHGASCVSSHARRGAAHVRLRRRSCHSSQLGGRAPRLSWEPWPTGL